MMYNNDRLTVIIMISNIKKYITLDEIIYWILKLDSLSRSVIKSD